MIDLGQKSKPPLETNSSSEPAETRYPSFTLSDENVDKIKEETGHECQVDDVYMAEVKLRVSGVRSDEYGKSITLDVVEMDDVEPEGGDAGDDNDGGKKNPSKALRYS